MIKKIDKYIFSRLLGITLFVLGVLIFIFIVIHFSDHSEDFTDNGATIAQVLGVYYLNYIPEIVRLVSPVAVFVACLYLTGQMADRLEITALKAAGVSLYRLLVPYLVFGFLALAIISYLDGFVIPKTNATRFAFENKYLNEHAEQIDNQKIYRQESAHKMLKINYYNVSKQTGYRVSFYTLNADSVVQITKVAEMTWDKAARIWKLKNIDRRHFTAAGFEEAHRDSADTTLSILPRDLARKTTDIYQLTYPQAQNYIRSIERSGAGSVDSPKVQFYGRLTYPLSILVVIIVGFAIACVRRKGGKGFYLAAGLGISFLYLVMLKVIEPFGSEGALTPALAVSIPHLFFLLVGLGMLISARK